MPLPSDEILDMMKSVAWAQEISRDPRTHQEIPIDFADYLAAHYPQASPYRRRRAAELATQAIGVGARLRDLPADVPLSFALSGARPPSPDVGVRVQISMQPIWSQRGVSGAPRYVDRYIPMEWGDLVGDVGAAVRAVLLSLGYSTREVELITWSFVGPTLFPPA